MRRLSQFRPGRIHHYFFSKYNKPKLINQGECFVWAYISYLVFPNVQLWHTQCHAFIRHQGKFYDSEALNGVDEYNDLPCLKRCGCQNIGKQSTVEFFKNTWYPEGYSTTWNRIENDAKKFLRKVG